MILVYDVDIGYRIDIDDDIYRYILYMNPMLLIVDPLLVSINLFLYCKKRSFFDTHQAEDIVRLKTSLVTAATL